MSPELLAYPFLFVAIFFESFALLTFLSAPARSIRARPAARDNASLPTVAMIVPCKNEAETIAGTADSLLALDYPPEKLEVILVDNGSTDATPQVMERYRDNPRVKIITEPKPGKHHAVNAGIAATSMEIVGCLDADSFVEPDALREIIPCFESPKVAAATAAMSVHKPGSVLQHMQNAEYIFGITLRHALSVVNGIYVTPGPFSLYRRSVIEKLGGFRFGNQTEDMEMALRIQRAGYWIDNAPRARVYTKAPRTLLALLRQRTRWTSGFMRNVLRDYRDLVGNPAYGTLGMIVLPIGALAIVSGMGLFLLAAFEFVKRVIAAYQVRAGIPLSYALTFHHAAFDWFYIPTDLYAVLAVLVVGASLSMIAIGKRMSKTPGSIALGLIAYVFMYGLIAPLWLFRASTDVALGRTGTWK